VRWLRSIIAEGYRPVWRVSLSLNLIVPHRRIECRYLKDCQTLIESASFKYRTNKAAGRAASRVGPFNPDRYPERFADKKRPS